MHLLPVTAGRQQSLWRATCALAIWGNKNCILNERGLNFHTNAQRTQVMWSAVAFLQKVNSTAPLITHIYIVNVCAALASDRRFYESDKIDFEKLKRIVWSLRCHRASTKQNKNKKKWVALEVILTIVDVVSLSPPPSCDANSLFACILFMFVFSTILMSLWLRLASFMSSVAAANKKPLRMEKPNVLKAIHKNVFTLAAIFIAAHCIDDTLF